jgi:outer membrane receptor protein involved in Fe transport
MFRLKGSLIFLFIIVFAFSSAQTSEADSSRVDILDLSFEELMKVTINTGTLSGIKKHNIPVALTTISAEDIRHSPARNLLDLLETYVPGALYMNHIEGPHPGMRGIIADRSYKVLLLVNGKVLNQKTRNGASTEVENWDMNDINEIEIIRGPGSVTYGPGAIMGVINIKTKNALTSPGLEVNSHYVSNYKSLNTSLSYGTRGDQISFYGYGSITRTPGFSPNAFAVDLSTFEAGYVGKGFSSLSQRSKPVQRYFNDFYDRPQIKAHMQLDFGDSWKLWARYTNSGATVNGTFYQTRPQLGFTMDSVRFDSEGSPTYYRSPLYGSYQDLFAMSHQQFSSSLQNDHHFASVLGLKNGVDIQTTLGYYNYSGSKGTTSFVEYPYSTNAQLRSEYVDKNSTWNQTYNFSESELLGTLLAKISFGDNKLAFGSSYAYNHFGPAWGTSFIKLQNLNPYLNNGNNLTLNINNDWSTVTYSFFGELDAKLTPSLTLLASGRSDKNTYSRLLISPRIALVSELNKKNVLKLVLQQSRRMNNAEELRTQNESNVKSDPETLTGIEVIYSKVQNRRLLFNLSTFYNDIGIISWSGTDNISKLTGNLKLAGVEAEVKYAKERFVMGLNHSFTKQLEWKMATDISVSGISYSDYDLTFADNSAFKGYGNNLNNWANHATKMFVRFEALGKKLTVHNDMRVYWRFEGARDGLAMIEDGIEASAVQTKVQPLLKRIYDNNVYETDLRVNSSATLKVNENISVTAFVINLLSVNNAKRYSYDAGIVVQGPSRVAYVEEPRSFGIKLNVSL